MPEIGNRQKFTLTYRDRTAETSTMAVYFDNITAISLPGLLTELGAFRDATNAITLGVNAKETWGADNTLDNDIPASNFAQRENKLLVQYQGVTTEKPYTLTIPTIDLAELTFLPGAGDFVAFEAPAASAAIQAWVTAFEALASAPDDPAENVVVVGMKFVGRNT